MDLYDPLLELLLFYDIPHLSTGSLPEELVA